MTDAAPSAAQTSAPAASSPEAELRAVYDQVDREVARLGPVCELSGRCCRFTEYGHTLFASTLEIRYLIAGAPKPSRALDGGQTCPWQDQHGRCTARNARPLGCRVFYCDPTLQELSHEISERSLTELKRITQRWGQAWSYAPLHNHLVRERDQGRLVIDLATVGPESQFADGASELPPIS
jgi:hypothetical protein